MVRRWLRLRLHSSCSGSQAPVTAVVIVVLILVVVVLILIDLGSLTSKRDRRQRYQQDHCLDPPLHLVLKCRGGCWLARAADKRGWGGLAGRGGSCPEKGCGRGRGRGVKMN